MAIIKCKMCGGDIELSADKTFGTCEYCGSVMTLPKVDDDQRAAAFNRGNHFRRIGEFDKALAVYERIVAEDNTDAEAHWCCALCRFGIEYVEDPTTYEWLPTCHRASFDSILEDVDYLAAVEYSDGITRRQYQKDAAKIAEVQRGILATSQREEPFDVFICYKESDEDGNRTVDSTLAQDIYYQLADKGYRVFFSRITLEDKAGAEYEPYIFAALNSAKVMIVVGTKPEHFSAVWVKNEWSRFLALMRKDQSKLLLPCYRDVDPYDLPEQLSVLQSYDMAKIGFIQDLIRGVSKVLDAEKEQPTVKETVIVQNEGGSNVEALLMRGQIALEDGDWNRADAFYEQVLNQNAKCAEAYMGKLLAREQCSTLDAFVAKLSERPRANTETKTACEEETERIKETVEKYTVPGYCNQEILRPLFDFDRTYQSEVASLRASYEQKQMLFKDDRLFSRAVRFANGAFASQVRSAQDNVLTAMKNYILQAEEADKKNEERIKSGYALHLLKAKEQTAQIQKQALMDRDALYQKSCQQQESATTEQDAEQAAAEFESKQLKNYQDCNERAEQCRELAKQLRAKKELELKAKQDAETRRKKEEDDERKRKLRNRGIAVALVAALAVACYCIATLVVIPTTKYNKAEKLLEEGQYDEACEIYERLGKVDRASATRYIKAQTLLEAEQYDEAYKILEQIGKTDEIDSNKYERASSLEKAGKNREAVKLYMSIPAYMDSSKHARKLLRNTISAGSGHTVGLLQNGTVTATGDNDDNQCEVSDWKDIESVSAGGFHTVGLRNDGTVIATGYNNDGRCDVSNWKDIVEIATSEYHTVGLRADGTVVAVGDNQLGQCNTNYWKDIIEVSAGSYHTVGLHADGTVTAAGNNEYKQCSFDGWKDIVAVSAGYIHTVGLRSDGTVIATGNNDWGQCDVSNWKNIVAISTGKAHTVGLCSNGTVVATGYNEDGRCDVSSWKNILSISAGGYDTIAQRNDGALVAVGGNGVGQCDVSDWKDIEIP